eukprot:Rhum_TRINITY_DN2656_c0_g1::Rhum_TRINITY_DN2656_c0_g1_i1::g.7865::m.7865
MLPCPICGLICPAVWEHVEWYHPSALSRCPIPGCCRQIKSGTAEGLMAHVKDVHNWPPSFAPVNFSAAQNDDWGLAFPPEPAVSLTCCKRKKKKAFKSATALAHHVVDVHASESCLRAVH